MIKEGFLFYVNRESLKMLRHLCLACQSGLLYSYEEMHQGLAETLEPL